MRLKNARISYEPLEDCDDFSYGFNGKYLKHVANYWLNKYNWKYHEGIINTLPQFITEIEGLKADIFLIVASFSFLLSLLRPLPLIII